MISLVSRFPAQVALLLLLGVSCGLYTARASAAPPPPSASVLRQQLQETEELITTLKAAREDARKTLAVYQDPNMVMVRVPSGKGEPPVYVPMPVEKLQKVITDQILLDELESTSTENVGARVVAKTAQVVRLLKRQSDSTRHKVLRGIMGIDAQLATEEKRRAKLLAQIQQNDRRVAGKPAGALDLDGTWRREDGHEVQFRTTKGDCSGVATKLTPSLLEFHFSEGEQTFRLKRSGPVTWKGEVKWRFTDGRSEWRPVTVTLTNAESMTDSSTGVWARVK